MTAPVRALCPTRGALLSGGRVSAPTFRAIALGTAGDDVGLQFAYEGDRRRSARSRADRSDGKSASSSAP